MSRYVWGVALLVAVGGLIAVGVYSEQLGGDDPQDPVPATADDGSSSSSDVKLADGMQTVSIKVPGMT
jgi:hypothetical protein